MTDHIDRSMAISAIEALTAASGGPMIWHSDATDAIECLPNVAEWISVNDELPEPFVTVLVYSAESGCTYTGCYQDHGGPHKYWTVHHYPRGLKIEITHWMPIPDRPEEES